MGSTHTEALRFRVLCLLRNSLLWSGCADDIRDAFKNLHHMAKRVLEDAASDVAKSK